MPTISKAAMHTANKKTSVGTIISAYDDFTG